MFESAILWAKEYGDVLGSIGFLFALSTVVITNGRVIYDRFRLRRQPQNIRLPMPVSTADSTSETLFLTPQYGDKLAIAVLPSTLLGHVDEDFSVGLVEDIIADVQKEGLVCPDLRSIAISQSELLEPLKAARKMGVQYLLKSSIRCQQSKYRVTAQLVDISGTIIWSDRYTPRGRG